MQPTFLGLEGLTLSPDERARGVVAASTGNHGRALSHAAKAEGSVGEQADGYVGVRTSVGPDVQTAITATNSARRRVYAASASDVGTSTEVAAARMPLPRPAAAPGTPRADTPRRGARGA